MATAGPATGDWTARCRHCGVALVEGKDYGDQNTARAVDAIQEAAGRHSCRQSGDRPAGVGPIGHLVEVVHRIPAGTIQRGRITED